MTSVSIPRSCKSAATSGSAATACGQHELAIAGMLRDAHDVADCRSEVVELIVERGGQCRPAVNADPQTREARNARR